ncbi:MAG TPA: hypothetical protein VHT25_13300, partial [Solirubrobacteraceae bacterium]|nr:hypothetical protein [Solirubrobacteraceae bacterium]
MLKAAGQPISFLARAQVDQRSDPRKKMVLARPQKKKRNGFLEELGEVMRRCLHIPVAKLVKEV